MEKKAGRKLPFNSRLFRAPLFCLCFSHVYEDERAKHGRRGVACVYLGYDPVNNTNLVMDWSSRNEYYCSDVEFFPNIFPFRANPRRLPQALNQYDDLAPHTTDNLYVIDAQDQRSSIRIKGYQFSGGRSISSIPDVDVEPQSVMNVDFGPRSDTWWSNPSSCFIVHPKYGPDPETMEEALLLPDANDWIMAELSEKESFKAHNVYDVVFRSQATCRGKRIFKPRVVLKRKFNPPDDDNPFGSLEKNKYRLTVAAYTKTLKEGIDYAEKHAGTVRWNAIKLLIAIAVKFDYDITLIDISTFFLYGIMDDEVYMEIPDRWAEDGESSPEYVWKLNKTVYGWPAAPNRARFQLNTTILESKEFKPTIGDDCVYVSTDASTGYAACGTHVDDITTVGSPGGPRMSSTVCPLSSNSLSNLTPLRSLEFR